MRATRSSRAIALCLALSLLATSTAAARPLNADQADELVQAHVNS